MYVLCYWHKIHVPFFSSDVWPCLRTSYTLMHQCCNLGLGLLLVHPKDHVPQQERPGVVYHIPCTNCTRTYIGQTGRTLTQHLKEHRRAVRNANTATSALAEHAHSTGHPVNWTEARVIDTCSYTSRRCLLESWMIHKETNHLNRELGTLPHIYKTLIKHP